MKIDIFYIATGVYAEYFPKFLETIPKFFPMAIKRIHIISDTLQEYDGYSNSEIKIDVNYQMDLPYPLICLLKTEFIKHNMPNDAEYVFYIDADTIFLDKSIEYWDDLLFCMNKNSILVSRHPGDHYPDYKIQKNTEAYFKKNKFYFSLISSFYGANKETMLKYCDIIGEKIRKDLTYHVNNHQEHYIPPLFDQDYMNKSVYDNDFDFCIKYFVKIEWLKNELDALGEYENCVIQKYNISKKFSKKNMK